MSDLDEELDLELDGDGTFASDAGMPPVGDSYGGTPRYHDYESETALPEEVPLKYTPARPDAVIETIDGRPVKRLPGGARDPSVPRDDSWGEGVVSNPWAAGLADTFNVQPSLARTFADDPKAVIEERNAVRAANPVKYAGGQMLGEAALTMPLGGGGIARNIALTGVEGAAAGYNETGTLAGAASGGAMDTTAAAVLGGGGSLASRTMRRVLNSPPPTPRVIPEGPSYADTANALRGAPAMLGSHSHAVNSGPNPLGTMLERPARRGAAAPVERPIYGAADTLDAPTNVMPDRAATNVAPAPVERPILDAEADRALNPDDGWWLDEVDEAFPNDVDVTGPNPLGPGRTVPEFVTDPSGGLPRATFADPVLEMQTGTAGWPENAGVTHARYLILSDAQTRASGGQGFRGSPGLSAEDAELLAAYDRGGWGAVKSRLADAGFMPADLESAIAEELAGSLAGPSTLDRGPVRKYSGFDPDLLRRKPNRNDELRGLKVGDPAPPAPQGRVSEDELVHRDVAEAFEAEAAADVSRPDWSPGVKSDLDAAVEIEAPSAGEIAAHDPILELANVSSDPRPPRSPILRPEPPKPAANVGAIRKSRGSMPVAPLEVDVSGPPVAPGPYEAGLDMTPAPARPDPIAALAGGPRPHDPIRPDPLNPQPQADAWLGAGQPRTPPVGRGLEIPQPPPTLQSRNPLREDLHHSMDRLPLAAADVARRGVAKSLGDVAGAIYEPAEQGFHDLMSTDRAKPEVASTEDLRGAIRTMAGVIREKAPKLFGEVMRVVSGEADSVAIAQLNHKLTLEKDLNWSHVDPRRQYMEAEK